MDTAIFKAYDIRGRYPTQINDDIVRKIAPAILKALKVSRPEAKIVVGHDARLSSPSLYQTLLDSLKNVQPDLRVIPAGMITTPMIYFLVDKLKADGGIVVTASHNSRLDNGLKVVDKNGLPISGKEIYKELNNFANPIFKRNLVKPKLALNYLSAYASFLKRFIKVACPLKVVFDCSNGTVGPVLAQVFKDQRLIKFKVINYKPDGNFKAHSPNPLVRNATNQLAREVRQTKSDIGIIFDADGDRIVVLDDRGRRIDARYILCLLSHLFKGPYLVNTALGKETMRWLLPQAKFIEEITGRYFIKRTAQKRGINLSVERSGHYFFKDFNYADSGVLAAIFVLNRLASLKLKKISLSQWLKSLPRLYYTGEKNLKIKIPQEAEKFFSFLKKRFKTSGYRFYRKDGLTIVGRKLWINARLSQTESVLRVQLASLDRRIFERSVKKCFAYNDF